MGRRKLPLSQGGITLNEYDEIREYFENISDNSHWTGKEVKQLVFKLLDLAEFERGNADKKQELHARIIKSLRQEGR
jgi:hypothetical protein